MRGYHDIIEKVLSTVPNIEDSDRKVLKRFTEDAGIGYSNFSEAEFKSLNNIITKLKTTHKELPGERYLNLLYQLNDFAYKDRFTKKGFKTRDNYMFENITAVINKARGRVIINAHNGHLQKTKFGGATSLGYLLNKLYGKQYYVFATDFNEGLVKVFDKKSGQYVDRPFGAVNDKGATEYYFKQCKFDNFILPFSNAKDYPAINSFLHRKLKMLRNMGSMGDIINWKIVPAENYDLIVFFRKT